METAGRAGGGNPIDLHALLTDAGIPVRRGGEHHHVSSQFLGLDCPWCRIPGGFHLGISPAGVATCWRCGPHSVAEVLAAVLNVPFAEARRLAGGRHVPRERPPGRLRPPRGVGPLLPAHRRYLRGRGLRPAQVAALWGVGGIGVAARLAWRLYIPVVAGGEVVSWTTRAIGNVARRYVAAPAADEARPHKELLYGADYCRGAAVAVEGPLDAWAGGPGFVATFGTGYSRAQALALAQFPVRAVCFDAEPEAQERQAELVSELMGMPGLTYSLHLETGKDAGEADPAEIAEIRREVLGEK